MRLIVPTIALTLLATAAFAQAVPAMEGTPNAAVKGMKQNNSATAVPGANSFTMAQAQHQIEGKGYTKVTGLKKDANGIWRGTATLNGNSGPVSVDYQGNVNAN
jgi:hypothetical protein